MKNDSNLSHFMIYILKLIYLLFPVPRYFAIVLYTTRATTAKLRFKSKRFKITFANFQTANNRNETEAHA